MYLFCGRRKAVCKMLGEELGAELWAGGGTIPFQTGSMQNEELSKRNAHFPSCRCLKTTHIALMTCQALCRELHHYERRSSLSPPQRRAHGHAGPSSLPSRGGSALPLSSPRIILVLSRVETGFAS